MMPASGDEKLRVTPVVASSGGPANTCALLIDDPPLPASAAGASEAASCPASTSTLSAWEPGGGGTRVFKNTLAPNEGMYWLPTQSALSLVPQTCRSQKAK